jgi:uracil phosphoribosyltransferase
VPNARVAHIGLYREPETFVAVEYFFKAPSDLNERLVSLIGVPEGIERMRSIHPDVPIWLAAVDDGLDEHAYILPGLGDAGDRAYGTK